MFQRWQIVGIGKTDVAIGDLAAKPLGALVHIPLTDLGRRVEDFKDAFAGSASRLDELIQAVQAADGFVKKTGQDDESCEFAELHRAAENGTSAESQHENQTGGGEEIHRRRIERPRPHNDQSRLTKLLADGVEMSVFLVFPDVSFDLANAGQVVVQEGIHRGGSLALEPVTFVRGEGVGECADDEKRDRNQREPC